MTDITPRTNTELFGHEDAEAQLLGDLKSGTLAHGWIISGPRGIGKATLAYRFARTLLKNDTRIAANSHADLLVIEPVYDEKKEEYAREVSVEQARQIGKFLSLTPGEGDWRLVIIDSADILNASAANAILKILEEPPPQAVLLLLAHNPGRLISTIRSRCHVLRLKPLAREDFSRAVRHIAPDIAGDELTALGDLSDYSPGVALELREQGAIEVYDEMLRLLSTMPQLNPSGLHAFAEKIGSGTVHTNWQMFSRLMLCLLSRVARLSAEARVDAISIEEANLLPRLVPLHPRHIWAAKWQQAAAEFSLAEGRHLDYKQIIIAFFHSLASSEGFQIGIAAA